MFSLVRVEGIFKKILHFIGWITLGFLFLLKINLEDTCVFFNILCFEKSLTFNHEEEEKKKLI